MGSRNIVNSSTASALGMYNQVNGYTATAIGVENRVSDFVSAAFGTQLIIKTVNSYAIGQYNDTTATNKLFEIGNGDYNIPRSNALTILKNGNTGIGTTTPATTLEVNGGIKSKYSGSVIKSVIGNGAAVFVNLTIPV